MFNIKIFAGICATGSLFPFSLIPAPLPCTVSYLGNSFPGAAKWVQQDIKAMVVTEDGAIYTNIEWDEAGREVGVYKNGEVIGLAGHTHGWGYNGGSAIALNGKYLFIGQSVGNEGGGLKDANTWPAKGFAWQGVSRRLRAAITKGAPFAGGKGGKGDTLKGCFLEVCEMPEKAAGGVMGLAVDESRLFVSDAFAGQIKVYDTESMQLKTAWPLERPGQLALGTNGVLWVLQKGDAGHAAQIISFKTDGQPLRQRITCGVSSAPSSFCLTPDNQMLVALAGPAQQIVIIDSLSHAPKFADTFGKNGGIYSGTPGAFGPLKFNHPRAVACDGKGNIYVAQDGQSGGGGTVLESYTPGGQLNWRLFGLEFVDMADVDPASDSDVFTKEEHFQMDYSRPAGQDWTYQGFTIHRFKYPEDPRLHVWSAGAWVRRIYGTRFLFVNDMNGEYLQVYRFDAKDGEIAAPSGLFAKRHVKKDDWPPHQPAKGEWIWRDGNGNGAFDAGEFDSGNSDAPGSQGWWVDSMGDVWLATETQGIHRFSLQGLDGRGNPIWDYAHLKTYPHPPEFKQVKRLRYYPGEDTMYLGGTTEEHKNQHWKPMGPVLRRYDHWTGPNRKLRWEIVAPYAPGSRGHESCEPMGFDVAGDYVFVPYTGASKEKGYRSGHIEIFRANDGNAVGCLEPSAEIGEIGLQDIRECLAAHRRADGEYLVFLEEDWKAKILMYRWRP